jgi:alpha-galactosidase/6-phospho-beta-glucosidase family protein
LDLPEVNSLSDAITAIFLFVFVFMAGAISYRLYLLMMDRIRTKKLDKAHSIRAKELAERRKKEREKKEAEAKKARELNAYSYWPIPYDRITALPEGEFKITYDEMLYSVPTMEELHTDEFWSLIGRIFNREFNLEYDLDTRDLRIRWRTPRTPTKEKK